MDSYKLKQMAKKAATSKDLNSANQNISALGLHPTQFTQVINREFVNGNMLELSDSELSNLVKLYPDLKPTLKHKKPELKLENTVKSLKYYSWKVDMGNKKEVELVYPTDDENKVKYLVSLDGIDDAVCRLIGEVPSPMDENLNHKVILKHIQVEANMGLATIELKSGIDLNANDIQSIRKASGVQVKGHPGTPKVISINPGSDDSVAKVVAAVGKDKVQKIGGAELLQSKRLGESDKKPVEHTVKLTMSLKDVAEALGYKEWAKFNDYLDADGFDDIYHGGYSSKDAQNMSVKGMDDVEKIFPEAVAMAAEAGEREGYAAAITQARRDAVIEALEKISVPGEYMSADMDSISKAASIKSASIDGDKITVEIENPEHLLNDIINGVGLVYPEMNPFEKASDKEIEGQFLANIGDYFDVYGDRKPDGELDSRFSPDVDDDFVAEEVKFRAGEMSIDEIAQAVVDAVDDERFDSEKEAIELAAKYSGESKPAIVKAVKAVKALLGSKSEKISGRAVGIPEDDDTVESIQLKEGSSKKIGEFEILDHGVEHSDYFQGAGVSMTKFDDIATGIGVSLRSALSDAAEQLGNAGYEISDDLASEIDSSSDKNEVGKKSEMHYFASIRVKGAGPTESKKRRKDDGLSVMIEGKTYGYVLSEVHLDGAKTAGKAKKEKQHFIIDDGEKKVLAVGPKRELEFKLTYFLNNGFDAYITDHEDGYIRDKFTLVIEEGIMNSSDESTEKNKYGPSFRAGDKVQFKADYDGTFKDFKGKSLTVKEFHNVVDAGGGTKKEPKEDGHMVSLVEIPEVNLIKTRNLEKLKCKPMVESPEGKIRGVVTAKKGEYFAKVFGGRESQLHHIENKELGKELLGKEVMFHINEMDDAIDVEVIEKPSELSTLVARCKELEDKHESELTDADKKELEDLGKRIEVLKSKSVTESVKSDGPGIYVGTYGKYNTGSIQGKWLNPADYNDADEFLEAAREVHKDEADPELMFQDYQGFPEMYYGESHIKPELWDWLAMSEDDQEMLEAYGEVVGSDYATLEKAQDAFQGKFESEEDWAIDFLESTDGINEMDDASLAHFLTISDTDARLIAVDHVDSRLSDMSDDDIIEQAEMTDEYEAEEDEAKKEAIVSKARDKIDSEMTDELESRIKDDPIGYFVDDLGYEAKDLVKNHIMSFDYKAYARDARIGGDISFHKKDGNVFVFYNN